MELFQLQYMLEVAKHGNFTQAANEVCVTPSSLSQQIKKLEDELGVMIFDRTTRSVHLTEAGVELIGKAQKIMDEVSNINEDMKKYVLGEAGRLNIAGNPALKVNGIMHKIATFQKHYPEITIDLLEAECFDLYPLLEANKIDAAFLTYFEKYEQRKVPLEGFPVVYDELVLVTNKSHPFAQMKVIDLRDARPEKFIFFCKSSGLYAQTLDACHDAGFEPKCAFETKYVDTCLGLVAEGIGIALLSSNSVKNTQWRNVTTIPLKQKVPRIISLVYQKKKNLSPILKNFRDFILKQTEIYSIEVNPALYNKEEELSLNVTLN